MPIDLPVYMGQDAPSQVVRFLKDRRFARPVLVADTNTYRALGEALHGRLAAEGFAVRTVLLAGDEVVADERYLMRVFVEWRPDDDVYLAVGSGTITDIVRFVAHRTRLPFVSVPTAPSVDGYPSSGAPIVVQGFKQTLPTSAPAGIFADLDTLCAAPRPMIAAGFGDILGKFTSLADWQLGRLLWDEPYDEAIAVRTRRAVDECVAKTGEISRASCAGIETLMHVLVESGLSIAEFGNSRPASGAEHHLSHYWEMKLLQQGRPAILHGAKVGVATVAVAELYARVRQLSRAEVEERLARASFGAAAGEAQRLHAVYGTAAASIIADHRAFLDLEPAACDRLRMRICQEWPRVQEIAASVPGAQALAGLLRQVGGPVDMAGLGLDEADLAEALQYAHYLRDRFTVLKLGYLLGVLGA